MTTLDYTHFILLKMSLRERLGFLSTFSNVDLVLQVLRLDFFPPHNFFPTVFFPTCFANVLSFLLPLTSACPNLWSSDFKRICSDSFCSSDYLFLKKGIAVLPRICARVLKPLPRCLPCPQKIRKSAEI